MNPFVYLLITVFHGNPTGNYGDSLLKCALCVNRNSLPDDLCEYPLEPENRAVLHKLLPEHVQSCGPIVDVEKIFSVHVVK
jgi:hypothetical protein